MLPVYNQKNEYLAECLKSIEAQEFRGFKLVIVIDGANRETAEAVYEAAGNLTVPCEIIKRDKNKGIAFSLNEGFARLGNCSYLTWVSSDNIHYPRFLDTLVREMQVAGKDFVLVYSLFRIINSEGDGVPERGYAYKMTYLMDKPREFILRHNFIGPSFLFRRDAYTKAGGYDPKYEKVEDYEFWLRLFELGEIRFIPEALMNYRVGGEFAYTTTTPREQILLKMARAGVDHRERNGDKPKVTVLLSAYNQEKFIEKAIGSVLAQTFTDFHLVVINDGSTDNTPDRVNRFSDSRIILVELAKNRGKPGAMNAGLKFALGDYILDLDADDWLEPETLEVMVREMESLPESVAMVYANRKIWYQRGDSLEEGAVYPGLNYTDKYEVVKKMKTHCPRFYRKNVLMSVGGWQTKLFTENIMAEDLAMMLRLAEHYQFHWINRVLYHQRRHESNMSKTAEKKFQAQVKCLVKEALKRWGCECNLVFKTEGPWVTEVAFSPGKSMSRDSEKK